MGYWHIRFAANDFGEIEVTAPWPGGSGSVNVYVSFRSFWLRVQFLNLLLLCSLAIRTGTLPMDPIFMILERFWPNKRGTFSANIDLPEDVASSLSNRG